jgi:outer membrane immunogenic protein
MKKKLLVAVAASVIGTSVMAQSAFEGFYGQIATGYESNDVSSINGTGVESVSGTQTPLSYSASSQNFGSAPLVLGLGYNFSVAPKWLLGIGVDYSALSQTSSEYPVNVTGFGVGVNGTGNTIKVGNRFNVFVTPGYAIDKDKLVYLKAGYSSVDVTQNASTGACIAGTGCFTNAAMQQTTPGSQTKTVSGYVVGLGYKQMITQGFYGFAEANYMSYGKANFSQTSNYTDGSGGSVTNNTSGSLNSYQALVGVGYKF